MIEEKRKNLTPLQIWILAARPKTLPAAAAPVIVGSSLAFRDGLFNPLPALAALLAALLLQIGANLANDVFDYYRGADTSKRLGPLRVTSAGLLAPEQVRGGMLLTFFLAALLGIYLTAVAGWVVVLIGLAAIAAAVAYTGGPFPFGYYGLGDMFVFIFFGLAAVGGTYYVQAGSLTAAAVWSAAPMGLLITALLVVNNLRDIETDRQAGKRTLAVRFGVKGARVEYVLCLAGAYLTPLLMGFLGVSTFLVLLSWLSLPLAISLTREVFYEKGRRLNHTLAGTGRLVLVYGVLFSVGLIIPVLM
jgi:1,4-dihydroxy-2-naphthoate polyprenyltransferase